MLSEKMVQLLMQGTWETLYMTIGASLFAYLLGLPIGVILYMTRRDGLRPCRPVNMSLGVVVNILRSIPFLILMVAIQSFTRLVVGTTVGTSAAMLPLVVASAPYVGRLVESSLCEVDKGVIEAAESMGSSMPQIIWKVLLPEARPSLLTGAAIAVTTILSYSAMAGFCGGGGLGSIALNYGLYRYDQQTMWITVVIIVIIVQIFQEGGLWIARHADRR